MHKFSGSISFVVLAWAVGIASTAQTPSGGPTVDSRRAESAASLAEGGRCAEALPLLARSTAHLADKQLQKRVGLDGVRCATLLQRWSALLDFTRALNQQFPRDPEVLYISIHAYSDLSNQAAKELAQTSPSSLPALEMDAEVNEMQGKWDQAAADYQKILEQNSRYPGIHFRMARLLLSRPDPAPDFRDQAKKHLQQELEIDPANAGAEYISGELARQSEDFAAAEQHFARASKLDPNFADAFVGLGMSLIAQKKYQQAIAPLESAVKLQPGSPVAHYGLGTAYARTGRKEDAERQFALQQQATESTGGQGGKSPQ
jgi:tetratricopeptide (TPR) repeat protein